MERDLTEFFPSLSKNEQDELDCLFNNCVQIFVSIGVAKSHVNSENVPETFSDEVIGLLIEFFNKKEVHIEYDMLIEIINSVADPQIDEIIDANIAALLKNTTPH